MVRFGFTTVFDAAPLSVVVLHFSPRGFDELQLCSRIRVRSIRFVGLEFTCAFWEEIQDVFLV